MAISAEGFYDRNMAVNDLKRQLEKSQIEIEELRTRLETLRERNNKLSETNSLAPKRIALLEERLRDSKILLSKSAKENDKLITALNETRNQIASLKVEVSKLSQPPIGYGTFLKANDDGTVDVDSNGKKLRVNLHPDIDISGLVEGDEVALNESLNVV
ncbi:MAG: proteasome ATPase, partial [Actinomycetota bacterium]|nr:proteasome ATPase [Actinomycetota bacterium]